jgi:chemotaxis protein histidine kinase CheA
LGNFSPEDAQAVIERLTERTSFQLESRLISQLVRDLAGELGEVRPIELQVVGAQLQTDKITTLARYQEFGTKEELVRRYLDEVVSDCGVENQQAADLVLYLLTDEKGTRPLKTRAELERDLQPYLAVMIPPSALDPPHAAPLTRGENSVKVPLFNPDLGGSPGFNTSPRRDRVLPETDYLEASQLDLVLQIFVKSGLVLLLPENPEKRYQLVHDYLAAFIRQQQEPRLKQLIAELDRERQQRKKVEAERQLTEEELQRVEQARQKLNRQVRRAMAGLMLTGVVAGVIVVSLGGWATRTVGNANSQLRVVQQNADAADEKAKEADRKAKAAQAQYQVANRQVIAAKGQVQAANSQFAAAQNQYKDAQAKLKDAAAKTQQAEKNRKEAEERKKAAEQQAQQAQQQIQAANQNLKTAEEKVAQAQQQFETANQAAAAASREAQQARQQQQQLQQQVLAAQNTLQQAQAEQKKAEVARAEAQQGTRLEQAGANALFQFLSSSSEGEKVQALFSAVEAGQSLETLVENDRPLKNYPATSPLLVLQMILDDIQQSELTKSQLSVQGVVASISFSPDGQRLAIARRDGIIELWNHLEQQLSPLAQQQAHQGAATSISFSHDGQHLITAGQDGMVRLWKWSGQQLMPLGQWQAHQGEVTRPARQK